MAKHTLKLSTMIGENFEIDLSELAKTALKLSMVGEHFVIYSSQLAKNALTNYPPWLEKIL